MQKGEKDRRMAGDNPDTAVSLIYHSILTACPNFTI